MAAAVVRSLGSTLGKNLREIRVHLCQTSAASKGARDFVEQHYVTLKKSNPNFPILIRECSGVQARLWARYGVGGSGPRGPLPCLFCNYRSSQSISSWKIPSQMMVEWEKTMSLGIFQLQHTADPDFGKEQSISVDNASVDQVAKALQTLVQSKP